MLKFNNNIQSEIIFMTMEEMVPEDSLFRKIDKYIDFTFIDDMIKDLYCENNGRPSVDPKVLFKIVFIQTIDGLKSMRQTCKKIQTDAEYRWFLGIPFGQDTPHFSTFSKNYERRFKGTDIFEKIFIEIVNQAIKYKLIDGTTFYTDSTHKKANANKNKFTEEIVKEAKKRRRWLEKEINEERKKQGRKEFEYKDEYEEKTIKSSTTDNESGYYHRDNKEKGFMYLDHRTVDHKANIIVDCYITKGNIHDSVPYIDRLKYLENMAKKYPNKKIRIGGHSKGGNVAIYSAITSCREVQDRIIKVDNYDGPGFSSSIIKQYKNEEIIKNIETFIPQESIIGRVLNHKEKMTISLSTEKGVLQHDIYSWQVVGTKMLKSEKITNNSEEFNKTLVDWLENTTNEQRKVFIDTVFELFYSTEAESFGEIMQKFPISLSRILKKYQQLSEEDKKIMTDMVKIFLGSYVNVIKTREKNKFNIIKYN